jgi:hypothetical protein
MQTRPWQKNDAEDTSVKLIARRPAAAGHLHDDAPGQRSGAFGARAHPHAKRPQRAHSRAHRQRAENELLETAEADGNLGFGGFVLATHDLSSDKGLLQRLVRDMAEVVKRRDGCRKSPARLFSSSRQNRLQTALERFRRGPPWLERVGRDPKAWPERKIFPLPAQSFPLGWDLSEGRKSRAARFRGLEGSRGQPELC